MVRYWAASVVEAHISNRLRSRSVYSCFCPPVFTDATQRLDMVTRDCRDLNEKNARLEKSVVQLQSALAVSHEARQVADNRAAELSQELQFVRSNLDGKASASELAELVHILQRLQANKAEKSGLAELAKASVEHGDRLHEQSVQLNALQQSTHSGVTQLAEGLQQLQQRLSTLPTSGEMELKAGRAELQQLLQVRHMCPTTIRPNSTWCVQK
jgi:hypothetical protein